MPETMNILLANANLSYLEVTKRMLRYHNEDYNIEGVTSIEECLEKVFGNGYDAVLIDGDLLDGNGLNVLDKVSDINHAVPVILTINEEDTSLIDKVQNLGGFNLIYKKKGYLSTLPSHVKNVVESRKAAEQEKIEIPSEPEFAETSDIETTFEQQPRASEGFFILDRRGRFLSANPAIQLATRYTEDELLELTITDLMSEDHGREFLQWLVKIAKDETAKPFRVELLDKVGEGHVMDLHLTSFRDDQGEVIGYKGRAVPIAEGDSVAGAQQGEINQATMITEIIGAIQSSYTEPLNVLLARISEIICQVFGFRRSTVALLDRKKRAFIKQAMVGYVSSNTLSIEQRVVEVPEEVINRIFADRFRIKVIYYSQDKRETREFISPGIPERRTQKRRPDDQWNPRDLILLNLTDQSGNTFGYVSLDDPLEGNTPTRNTFYNLELFASLTSMAIENYYRFSALERRSRRLKQVLVTSNIFKLHLSLSELLKEVVWAVKFSLDFNMVGLILISKKTGMLETKAIACEDKIKMLQLRELKYDLKAFGDLLKDDYRRGKSFLVTQEESVIKPLKRIYYGSQMDMHYSDGWPYWGLILVPLKSREGKIIGFLVVDDPADHRMPGKDTVHTLEILANQIAVAIDNRVMYVQAKEQLHEASDDQEVSEDIYHEDYSSGGLKKLVEKFLR